MAVVVQRICWSVSGKRGNCYFTLPRPEINIVAPCNETAPFVRLFPHIIRKAMRLLYNLVLDGSGESRTVACSDVYSLTGISSSFFQDRPTQTKAGSARSLLEKCRKLEHPQIGLILL